MLIPAKGESTMLRSVSELENYTIGATDGTIGSVNDCYFDDEAWVVRYLVVRTGAWLVGRQVLISPYAVRESDSDGRVLHVSISKDQVKNSPSVDSQKPVSRQHEIGYSAYYGYPYYWGGAGLWGGGAYPGALLTGAGLGSCASDIDYARAQENNEEAAYAREARRHAHDDQHLRSCEAVKGYHVHATDGDIGHVDGFLVDQRTWAIRYLIVNTSNWWLGNQVLIAPAWFEDVSWVHSKITTTLTRHEVKNAPPYDSLLAVNRGDEEGIYRHYQRKGYWHDQNGREAA
jgi:sporulation protein YlmC with PRC-barrel domain